MKTGQRDFTQRTSLAYNPEQKKRGHTTTDRKLSP